MDDGLKYLLGINLKRLREKNGFSQMDLLDRLNGMTNQQHLSKIENGRAMPRPKLLNELIQSLKCEPADLLLKKDQHIIDDLDYKLLEYAKTRLGTIKEQPMNLNFKMPSRNQEMVLHEPKVHYAKKHKKTKKR